VIERWQEKWSGCKVRIRYCILKIDFVYSLGQLPGIRSFFHTPHSLQASQISGKIKKMESTAEQNHNSGVG